MQVQIIRPDGRTILVGGQGSAPGIPRTVAELDALKLQRTEINEQIRALRGRRNELDEQRHQASGAQRTAIEARIAEIDAQRVALDGRLDQINERLSNVDVSAFVTTALAPRRDPVEDAFARNMVPLAGMFSTFFLLPLAIAFARLLWKRGTAAAQRPALNEQAMVTRLEQLQTSVDAMAVEVERISENQRYVAKLQGEKERAALPR